MTTLVLVGLVSGIITALSPCVLPVLPVVLTTSVQGLRQQANSQISSDVTTLNQALSSLVKINDKLGDFNTDATSKASLLDQRDRLVSQVAGLIDVNVAYRDDGSVALTTRSGVGILDGKASTFSFDPVTNLSATQQYSDDASQNGVGTLTMTTPSGLDIDLVKELMELAMQECERYYPSFQFVIWGGRTAEDAIASSLLDTVGEA